MNQYKFYILCFVLVLGAFFSNAQTKKQFNGKFEIYYINSLGGSKYEIKGVFSDPTNTYKPTQVAIGDKIVDNVGNSFEILTVTYSGNLISTTSKAFDSNAPIIGEGVVFRPTDKGFPLITAGVNSIVMTSVVNTTTLDVDDNLPNYKSGSSLPAVGWKVGDVFKNTSDGALYKLTGSGWTQINSSTISISYYRPVTSTPAGKKGDLVKSYWDSQVYIYDGSSWTSPQEQSSIPSIPKFGDVFYDTSQDKIFMLNGDSEWSPISGSTIPKGPAADRPTTGEIGDFYYDTDNNVLYIYGSDNKWSELSIDGSTPRGIINPDPATMTIREGNLFYNTSDHRIYVYNGTMWMPMDNTLPGGQIYVGNASNVATPVEMFGDATISNNGKIIISEKAITDEKLDKENIPLSGFANPIDNVSLGNGTTNTRIINLANPIDKQDAATKNYVDILFSAPERLLSLPSGNFFVGNISNKAIATTKSSIPISGFGSAIADISLGDGSTNFRIINLADPKSPQDAVTKFYVDTRVISPTNIILPTGTLFVGSDINTATPTAKDAISFSDFGAAGKDVSLGGFKILNLADPTNPTDAVTKSYVDNKSIASGSLTLTDGGMFVGDATGKAIIVNKTAIPLSDFGAAAKDISLGTFKVTNLATPVDDSDAATKKYIDDLLKAPETSLSLAKYNLFVGNDLGMAVATSPTAIPISSFGVATTNISMGNATTQYSISFLADPLYPQDAATKNYVDSKISNPSSLKITKGYILVGNEAGQAVDAPKSVIAISDLGGAGDDVSMGNGTYNFKIVNLADPINDQDAATKKYVEEQTASTPSGDTNPSTAKIGDVFYNTVDKIFYVYDGTEWIETGGGSTPSGGTNPPSAETGDVFYNTTEKKLFVYDGTTWTPVGIDPDNMGNHTATETLKMGDFAISNDGDPTKGLTFDVDGNATLKQSLTVNGNLYTPSDKRLKTKIKTLTKVLEKINKIRGVSFEFRDKTKYASGVQIGFIAQELKKEFPELVSLDPNGFFKVNYTQLTAVLLQAIKEQQFQIKQQQSEINQIKQKMHNQQQQIDLIMKMIGQSK